MRKSWPFALAVIVVGGLAGVAIAGRPAPGDPFVLDPDITVGSEAPLPLDTIADPTISESTTTSIEVTTTTAAADASTTSAPGNSATTTTVAATNTSTTNASAPTTTVDGLLPRNQVRLVLANGDGRFRLASITADRVRPLGYIIDLADTIATVDATVIYFRDGFEEEAQLAALDLKVPDAIVAAFPANLSQPITNSDAAGDVIVVLGPDAPR